MRSWPPFPDMRTISLGIGQLRDLMAWMGRAAMICQHQPHGADQPITNAIDTHVQAAQTRRDNDEDGPIGVLVPTG